MHTSEGRGTPTNQYKGRRYACIYVCKTVVKATVPDSSLRALSACPGTRVVQNRELLGMSRSLWAQSTLLQFVFIAGFSPKQDPKAVDLRVRKEKSKELSSVPQLLPASTVSGRGGAVTVTADSHRVPFTHDKHSPKSCG